MKLSMVVEMLEMMRVRSWKVVDPTGDDLTEEYSGRPDLYGDLLVRTIEDGTWVSHGCQVTITIY